MAEALSIEQAARLIAAIERVECAPESGTELDYAILSAFAEAPALEGRPPPSTVRPVPCALRMAARTVALAICTLHQGGWQVIAVFGGTESREFTAADPGLALAGLELTVLLHELCPPDILAAAQAPDEDSA